MTDVLKALNIVDAPDVQNTLDALDALDKSH